MGRRGTPGKRGQVKKFTDKQGRTRWRTYYNDRRGVQRKLQRATRKELDEAWHGEDGNGGLRALILAGVDVRRGKRTDTVAHYQKVWERETNIAPKTMVDAKSTWRNHVEPEFGALPVIEVTKQHVRTWVSELRAAGRSDAVVQKAVIQLSRVMQTAVDHNAVAVNPVRGVGVGASKSGRVHAIDYALSVEQVMAIVRAIDQRFALLVKFLAFTGVRSGEAYALRVSDLDLNRGQAWVGGSLSRVGGVHTKETKTGAGRVVALVPDLVEELREHVQGKRAGDYVFTGAEGMPVHASNFGRRQWAPAVAKARAVVELPQRVVVHDLRHFFASWALSNGFPLVTVQQQLGHTSVTTTADMYARWVPSAGASMVAALGEAAAAAAAALPPLPSNDDGNDTGTNRGVDLATATELAGGDERTAKRYAERGLPPVLQGLHDECEGVGEGTGS